MSMSHNLRSAASKRLHQTLVAGLSTLALIGAMALTNAPQTKTNQAQAVMILVTVPANINQCTGCHGKDLKGRKGFSPSLTKSGVLKLYSKKAWETVMKSGKTASGGQVKPPMPVFNETPAVADTLYKYLHTLS